MTAVESGTIVRLAVAVAVSSEPGDAPTATPEKDLSKELENAITTDRDVYRAGDAVVVGVKAELAGEYVSVWAYSKKKAHNLGGWLLVRADGTVSITLADDLKHGKYSLSVQNADGDVIGWTEVRVDRAEKPLKNALR
jgi:5'-nucleotidase